MRDDVIRPIGLDVRRGDEGSVLRSIATAFCHCSVNQLDGVIADVDYSFLIEFDTLPSVGTAERVKHS
jgi:hypothetical protein